MKKQIWLGILPCISLLGLILLVNTSLAQGMPPMDVPGYGMGQLCGGQKGQFFITASGNNPFITFHMSGNTSMAGVFRVKFERLVFFNDTDSDGKLTSNDPVTNSIVLSTLAWTTGDLTLNGSEYQVPLTTTDPGMFDSMEFLCHFQNATTNDTSNLLKFDWDVTNMADGAYAGGNYVALQVQFIIDIHGRGNAEQMQFLNGTGANNNSIQCSPTGNEQDSEAEISWTNSARVNGTQNDHACGGNGEFNGSANVEVVRFAFAKFQNLSYDPTIGIPAASGIPGAPAAWVAGQVVLVSTALAVVLHRKTRRPSPRK